MRGRLSKKYSTSLKILMEYFAKVMEYFQKLVHYWGMAVLIGAPK